MDIIVPSVGESIYEAKIAKWLKNDRDRVTTGEAVCEIETDKVTLEITAESDGVLQRTVPEGATVKIGSIIGTVETDREIPSAPSVKREEKNTASPAARKVARERERATSAPGAGPVESPTPEKVEERPSAADATVARPEPAATPENRKITRQQMSPIRKRIAERLMAARQQTAMVTTFNEADVSRIQALRARHREDFRLKHGVSLGLISFFIKACVEALREFPVINARLDGDSIVFQHFYDIGIAISGEKGLVVPVLREADRLKFSEMELAIAGFVERIRDNRLELSELEGGTFTITNGGVFGSLLSTPILNPPQTAVLGMHAIQERPVAVAGQVVIRPMMYLALSYDHRLVDGRDAVLFLKRVKEFVEEPEEMLL